MITCNDERLNQQMKKLYDVYVSIDDERYEYEKLFDLACKIEKPLFYGSVIGGFILFMMILKNPSLFIVGCSSNLVNCAFKSITEVKLDAYKSQLDKVRDQIQNLEYKMHHLRFDDYELDLKIDKRLEDINKLKKSDGIKLSKHHDYRYTEYEKEKYERENDLRYNSDRYGIHYKPMSGNFNRNMTGDYENPVFVLMNNKGKVLSKRPKYNNNKKN